MKKVTFNEDKNKIYIMTMWNYAHRKARENTFMLDRLHFERRIQHAEIILQNVLSPNHRFKVYESRFCNMYS